MATVYDVEPNKLIEEAAKDLKDKVNLEMPEWAAYVKTGTNREKRPDNPDWWWARAAAVLRRIYIDGPVGVERLRTFYGGKKNMGRKPEKFRKASGKVIRTVLKQLDDSGLTLQTKQGRKITPKGQGYLDKISSEIAKAG